MLRACVRLRPRLPRLVSACGIETGQEKTRQLLHELEDFIEPTPKPAPELRGRDLEAWEPEVFENEAGIKMTGLGHSRGLITKLQEPMAMEPQDLRFKFRIQKMQALRKDQRYSGRGLQMLGPDLMAAHFVVRRGGRVKFVDGEWYHDRNLSVLNVFTKSDDPKVEAIDASEVSIVFEGFDYFRGLKHIRYLNLSRCHRLDDHCLVKIALHLPSLEVLDLSDCPNISERGLATLHSLTNLKKLIVRDVTGVMQKQLVCLLLEECNPNLMIEGVTYSKDTIDNEIEEDRKKYEARYGLREIVDYSDNYLSKAVAKVRLFEQFLKIIPKSSETGFLAKFLGHKGVNDKYSRIKDDF